MRYLKEHWHEMLIYITFSFWILFNEKITIEGINLGVCISYVLLLPILGITFISFQIMDFRIQKVKINKEIIKLLKEVTNYIFIFIIFGLLTNLWKEVILSGNTTQNQNSIEEDLSKNPIYIFLLAVIFAPLTEEALFRILPRYFIKNNIAYILISSFIFSYAHCITTPNSLLYVPMYLPDAIYLAYRYQKTEDVFVPITIHCFSNAIAYILLITSS